MECPFISDIDFGNIKIKFQCPCVERLEDNNDNFSCEDCVHYQSIQKVDLNNLFYELL